MTDHQIMSAADRAVIRQLARRIATLEKNVAVAARSAQMDYTSIEGTGIPVYDNDGTLRGTVGIQDDGTMATTAVNGPPPPQPSAPIVTGIVTGLAVTWDGGWDDPEDSTPLDLARVEVHVGPTSGFTPDGSTYVCSIVGLVGGSALLSIPDYVTRHVRLVAVNTSEVPSEPSDNVDGAALQITAEQIADGVIDAGGGTTIFYSATEPTDATVNDYWIDTSTGNSLHRYTGSEWEDVTDQAIYDALTAAADAQATADGKVKTFVQPTPPVADGVGDIWIDSDAGNALNRWDGATWVLMQAGAGAIADGSINDGHISDVGPDKVTDGDLGAVVTVSGRLATALTGARVELSSLGLAAYDADGDQTVAIGTDGSATITGRFRTAFAGRRVEIGNITSGSTTGDVHFWTGQAHEGTDPDRAPSVSAGFDSAGSVTQPFAKIESGYHGVASTGTGGAHQATSGDRRTHSASVKVYGSRSDQSAFNEPTIRPQVVLSPNVFVTDYDNTPGWLQTGVLNLADGIQDAIDGVGKPGVYAARLAAAIDRSASGSTATSTVASIQPIRPGYMLVIGTLDVTISTAITTGTIPTIIGELNVDGTVQFGQILKRCDTLGRSTHSQSWLVPIDGDTSTVSLTVRATATTARWIAGSTHSTITAIQLYGLPGD
jgi:hypothetical protein